MIPCCCFKAEASQLLWWKKKEIIIPEIIPVINNNLCQCLLTLKTGMSLKRVELVLGSCGAAWLRIRGSFCVSVCDYKWRKQSYSETHSSVWITTNCMWSKYIYCFIIKKVLSLRELWKPIKCGASLLLMPSTTKKRSKHCRQNKMH